MNLLWNFDFRIKHNF